MRLVETQGLTRRFGRTVALDRLDLTLETGQPIALVGPNGAGKTTLLSLLAGYLRPSAGEIRVLGMRPGDAGLHGRVAALPQDAELDPRFSVRRQLRLLARLQGLSRAAAGYDVERVLNLVQLSDAAARKPAELSHGMRKRTAIAQMLLGTPEFAMLDEPTAGLDPPNVRIIRDLISQHAGQTTFLISSHQLDELEKVCATVVFLERGRLLRQGPIDSAEGDGGRLTIRLPGVGRQQFIDAVQTLPGLRDVSSRVQGEYSILFDAECPFDQHLLRLLRERGWRYRQLNLGRTLEDRLFDNSADNLRDP